jgi:uncharacterized protein (DUF1330 family)
MKTNHKVAIALVAGLVCGGAVIQGLHAQATPPTYVVIDISAINDPAAFKAVPPRAGAQTLTSFGGKYIIRSESAIAVEGTPPKRFVVIQFDTLDHAKAWHASDSTTEVEAIRMKTTDSREFMVGGM